jgi:hypothetical protein
MLEYRSTRTPMHRFLGMTASVTKIGFVEGGEAGNAVKGSYFVGRGNAF